MTTPTTTTTTTTSPEGRATVRSAGYRLTGPRQLRSELIRFVTVRSNVITLAALGVVMALIGTVAAAASTGDVSGVAPGGSPGPGFSGSDPLTTVLAGATPGVLIVGVLGVLVGAREYGSGMIRTTMTAAPRRTGVLLARLAAFVVVVLPVAVVGSLGAYFVGTAILSAAGAPTAAWGDPGVARAVVGTGIYLTGVGVLGVCLGMLTRSIGQGVGWLIGLVVVVPGFGALLLPDDWQDALKYLPSNAGAAFTTITDSASRLGVGAGVAVLAAWIVAFTAATIALVRRRDV